MKKAVFTQEAPQPVGAYSQAVAAGDFLFLSGQIALDESTNVLMDGDAGMQTKKVMEHIGSILEAQGMGYEDLVKTSIFIADMKDFASVNQVYQSYLKEPYPARSCVAVKELPKGALVEIESIAMKKKEF